MIRDYVIPELRSRRYIHIWDAGCAMGPEPYSLAMVLRENMGMIFRNVKIHATDIDNSNLFGDIIKKGVYP
jgi:chemotaxis protein methyltransferase CheR